MTDKQIKKRAAESKSLGESLYRLYEQEVEFQRILWSNYLGTIERRFPAKIIGRKCFTLDGKTEIMDREYKKWSEYECLSKEEKDYLKGVKFDRRFRKSPQSKVLVPLYRTYRTKITDSVNPIDLRV